MGYLGRIFAKRGEAYFVVSTTDFCDLIVEHRHVVFAGKILGSV